MEEFIDMIGHAREYEFTAPAEAYPHRRRLDPLAERRARYQAQGRTWTDASDLAVLASLHKQLREAGYRHREEMQAVTSRLDELEARHQQLINSLMQKGAGWEQPIPLVPVPVETDAQARKRQRAKLREQAAIRDRDARLVKQYRKRRGILSEQTMRDAAKKMADELAKLPARKPVKKAKPRLKGPVKAKR